MTFPQAIKKTGTFTATSGPAITNINCGFIPDIVTLINVADAAGEVAFVKWNRGTMGEGVCMTSVVRDCASTGLTWTWLSSGGITSLNTVTKEPAQWTASNAYVVGDIVRPTINNGYFYKCSTAGTSHTTEPTWGTTVGGTTSEGGGTAVWTCYDQEDLPVRQVAKLGFTIPAALQVASAVCYWEAERIVDEA